MQGQRTNKSALNSPYLHVLKLGHANRYFSTYILYTHLPMWGKIEFFHLPAQNEPLFSSTGIKTYLMRWLQFVKPKWGFKRPRLMGNGVCLSLVTAPNLRLPVSPILSIFANGWAFNHIFKQLGLG